MDDSVPKIPETRFPTFLVSAIMDLLTSLVYRYAVNRVHRYKESVFGSVY